MAFFRIVSRETILKKARCVLVEKAGFLFCSASAREMFHVKHFSKSEPITELE